MELKVISVFQQLNYRLKKSNIFCLRIVYTNLRMRLTKFTDHVQNISGKYLNNRYINVAAILLCVMFILAGSAVSLNRYWQYETFFYDFGIFDQALWKVAHFSPPIIDHLVVGGKWIFADHFNPSIFILSPLYWLTDKREIILIAQAVIVGLSGLVLYLIGFEVLKNRLYSFSVLVCYLLFAGLQNAVITDFHEVTIATLPLMLTYLAIIKRRALLFLCMLILTLGFKESNFLLGFAIGISIFFINRSWLKLALITCAISLIWGFVSINYVIPYFSGGIYQYGIDISYNPVTVASTFFDNKIKIHTLLYTFLSFGFLPLLSYQFWTLIFQDFLTRFYSPLWFLRFDLGLHYSALTSAIMGLSSIFSLKIMRRFIRSKIILNLIALILILNALFLYRVVLHAPFGLAYNPRFYEHSADFQFLDTLVTKVPQHASVMAQNNLAIRFDHQQVWTLQSDQKKFIPDYYVQKKPQYIVIDARQGQNPNNYFLVKDMGYLLEELKKDTNYLIVYQTSDQYIFKRKN
jgi:uncharacterized membrane protein